MKKILVTLDGSKLAEAVLPYAEDIAQSAGAEIILLRVVPPVPLRSASLELRAQGYSPEEMLAKAREEAEAYLAEVEKRLLGHGAKVRAVVKKGPVVKTIVDYIRQEGVDLVAMSTNGRSGVTRWVCGSVAGAVMRQAKIPVAMLRPRAEHE